MKLIFCTECTSIVSLQREITFCSCKQSCGYYLENGLDAYYAGNAIPLGINNTSFLKAVRNQPKNGLGKTFQAFVIPKDCSSFQRKDEILIKQNINKTPT